MVTGSESPPTLNTELFVLAALTVTLAPLAERLPDPAPLVPMTTLPIPRVAGATLSCPTAVAPVPDNAMVSVGLDPSEVIVTVPLAAPATWGAKATVKVVLWEALSVSGVVIPVS